jgi:hypothetical protein
MILRDDCALNIWRIQIAPNLQACTITDFPKSLGHAHGHCGAHFERLVDANKNYNTGNAAVPSQNLIRSRNLGSLPTQMRAETRSKFEFPIRTRKFPVLCHLDEEQAIAVRRGEQRQEEG